jgi:anti-sigma B factor antagonist
MNVEILEDSGKKVVVLSGEIDMYSSPDLRETLLGLVKEKPNVLLLDFKGVEYIDSSGIATFVEGLKCMKGYGGSLRFFNIPQGIMEIFRFSKLDRVFEIFASADDAIDI